MRPQLCAEAAAPITSDVNLMIGIQQRKPEALSALFDRYSSVLKALVMRIIHNEAEAEDLLMEIYMEIWNHASNYTPERGKPLGWLVTLTRRRAIDRLRKRQSYIRVTDRFQHETESRPEAWTRNSVDPDIERHDLHEVLARIIANLPTSQQQAIDLAFYKGMSQREIANHTQIPLGTIKTRLELGLRKIADALKNLRHEF